MVLEVQLCPQLNKPPRASGSQFLVVEQVGCHQMEMSVCFSKKELEPEEEEIAIAGGEGLGFLRYWFWEEDGVLL